MLASTLEELPTGTSGNQLAADGHVRKPVVLMRHREALLEDSAVKRCPPVGEHSSACTGSVAVAAVPVTVVVTIVVTFMVTFVVTVVVTFVVTLVVTLVVTVAVAFVPAPVAIPVTPVLIPVAIRGPTVITV
jgi:hypothetical protein